MFKSLGWSLLLACAACQAPLPALPVNWGADAVSQHNGPEVARGITGTARFASVLYDGFDPDRAMDTAAFADQFYREPGNDGFEAVLDHVIERLARVGYGQSDRYELRIIETPLSRPSWTPRSASIELIGPSGRRVVQGFDEKNDRQRTMLPTNSIAGNVSGKIVFELDDVTPGAILVTDRSLRIAGRAKEAGAVAVFAAPEQSKYNLDPTGQDRHLDAIHYGRVSATVGIPVAYLSPRVYAEIKSSDATRAHFRAKVDFAERPLRTVVATVVGKDRSQQTVALAAHVQEPGAVDNASGVGGQLEGARSLALAIQNGDLSQPSRSISFIWGDEMTMSRVFLEHTARQTVAAFSSDMTGASREMTGAIPLLEREPDPGALMPLPPDEHTLWGAGRVDEDKLRPSGVSIVARSAMADVGVAANGWETAEHPWEGGSDHDVFLRAGIPSILMWHFTDLGYHTSLDRMENVDAHELRRMSVALVVSAMSIADPLPTDLERYLETLNHARRLRIAAAEEAGEDEIAEKWRTWFTGARIWLRNLSLGLPLTEER